MKKLENGLSVEDTAKLRKIATSCRIKAVEYLENKRPDFSKSKEWSDISHNIEDIIGHPKYYK